MIKAQTGRKSNQIMTNQPIQWLTMIVFLASTQPLIGLASQPIPPQYWGVWGNSQACQNWSQEQHQALQSPLDGALISEAGVEFTFSKCRLVGIQTA